MAARRATDGQVASLLATASAALALVLGLQQKETNNQDRKTTATKTTADTLVKTIVFTTSDDGKTGQGSGRPV